MTTQWFVFELATDDAPSIALQGGPFDTKDEARAEFKRLAAAGRKNLVAAQVFRPQYSVEATVTVDWGD